jgi:membrane protein implicated in regulation of membrane protease activity
MLEKIANFLVLTALVFFMTWGYLAKQDSKQRFYECAGSKGALVLQAFNGNYYCILDNEIWED